MLVQSCPTHWPLGWCTTWGSSGFVLATLLVVVVSVVDVLHQRVLASTPRQH